MDGKFERLVEMIFSIKSDMLPRNSVEDHPDLLPEMDFCVTIQNVSYGIVQESNELLEALQSKLENEFQYHWTGEWKKLSEFILAILEHFPKTTRGLIENKLIYRILSDNRSTNLSFDAFELPTITNERNKRSFFSAVIRCIYQLPISNQQKLETLRLSSEINRFGYQTLLYHESVAHSEQACDLINHMLCHEMSSAEFEILKCTLCGIASDDVSKYRPLFEKILSNRDLKCLAVHALGYAKAQGTNTLTFVLDLIEEHMQSDGKFQSSLCFVYLSFISAVPPSSKISKQCTQELSRIAATQSTDVLDTLVEHLNLATQPAQVVYLILRKLLENSCHRKEYYEVVRNGINRFDAILSFEKGKPKPFFDFLQQFIAKTAINFKIDQFAVSLDIHLRDNKVVKTFVVKCLSSNLGKVRYLGNVLLNELLRKSSKLDFTNELNNLTENEKVILIFSIRFFPPLDFIERFSILIPIIKQNSELTNILIVKFVVSMVEDFPTLITALEDEFGNDSDWFDNIGLLKEFSKKSTEMARVRWKIKELSPEYTFSKLYRLHQRIHMNKFSEDISKGIWDRSIFSILGQKIELLKGGGHRSASDENAPIQRLSRVETSFSIPRSIYRNPELDQLNLSYYFSSDFKSEEDIKEWLTKFL